MQSRRERVRLETRLAIEREQMSGRQRFAGEAFDHDADLAFADKHEAGLQYEHDQRQHIPIPSHTKPITTDCQEDRS